MSIIDFTEIPVANTGKGNQDNFELFARDFFVGLGFGVEENPSRGADGGKDLIITESLLGTVSSTTKRWIVSCKHFVYSGKSVGNKDEIDVLGRMRKFKAQGFMAFYSTIPSSGLMQTLRIHEDEVEIQVWDAARIEAHLLTDKRLRIVFERYFPQSFKIWKSRDTAPTRVFETYAPLECAVCGKDLLVERSGNVVFAVKLEDNKKHIFDVYWVCRGDCDRVKERQVWRELNMITSWEDIADLSIPIVYVRWFIATFNNLRDGRYVFTDEAFEKFKYFTLYMSQIVVRETTVEQWQRSRDLADIPSFLGGLGY